MIRRLNFLLLLLIPLTLAIVIGSQRYIQAQDIQAQDIQAQVLNQQFSQSQTLSSQAASFRA